MIRPVIATIAGLAAVTAIVLTPHSAHTQLRNNAAGAGCPAAAAVASQTARLITDGKPSPLYSPALADTFKPTGLVPVSVQVLDASNVGPGRSRVELIVDAHTQAGAEVAVPMTLAVACASGRVTVNPAGGS